MSDGILLEDFGDTSSEVGSSIVSDSSGNLYITGQFSGSVTFGSTILTSIGEQDIFTAKLDSSGNITWATNLGTTAGRTVSYSITTDKSSNLYTTGAFSTPVSLGTIPIIQGDRDIFVAKQDSNGDFIWAKSFGSNNNDQGSSISTDSSGNLYVTGYFSDSISFGNTILTSSGDRDIFAAKLDSSGNVTWAKSLGGTQDDIGRSIITDSNGNAYIIGEFRDKATFGNSSLTAQGSSGDIFVARLDSNGNVLWAQGFGNTTNATEIGRSIVGDKSGNLYITGEFSNSITFGSTILTAQGSSDIFVAKLDSSGNITWAKNLGVSNSATSNGITIDSNGNIYTTGEFIGSVTFGSTIVTAQGNSDFFLAKLDSNGKVTSVNTVGGNNTGNSSNLAIGYGIATDNNGNIYTAGISSSTTNFVTKQEVLPTITIASDITSRERGSTDGTFVITLDNPAPAGGLTINYSIAGTASLTTNYNLAASSNITNLTATSFTIAAGQRTAILKVTSVAGAVFEAGKTVQLVLTSGNGYNIGTSNNASLPIVDQFECYCDFITPPDLNNLSARLSNLNPVNNSINNDGNNKLIVGTQLNDQFFGLGGNDFVLGEGGNDNLVGGTGSDSLYGSKGNDWLSGGEGDDFLNGNEDIDFVNGNQGNDTVRGGQKNDLVRGGKGNDVIYGDQNDDVLAGDLGDDTIFGAGTIDSLGGSDNDTIFGGEGNDLLYGNAGTDFIFAQNGNDTLFGGKGNDFLFGGTGDDRFFGDLGNDFLCGGDGNDTLNGGDGNDEICGGNGNDSIFGNKGADWLFGETGNDTLYGGQGDDTLVGGDGNDLLFGDNGNNYLVGGNGSDRFVLSAKGSELISDFQVGVDLLGLSGGLTFPQLSIVQSENNTLIRLLGSNELLATLKGITANSITQSNFISLP
ncbi:SBBP repeat-containing protein [Aerosakkonemataceae cyanobacterium BLCC-F50]|uniref:SBBP repeat-containing protein n=1 Tax=Floridaenema flaviceps BLCC-F50 TaxID=3153642 RepID=A0ABV4XQW5_9CYAN